MAVKKKSWKEKLNNGRAPIVEICEGKFADIPAGSIMLIPTPLIVDEYIKNIPEGVSTNILQMRKDLVAEYNAQYSCPLTSGIFLRIAAEAAYEEHLSGKPIEDITPFWRIIDSKSTTIKKLTFGKDFVIEQRKKEGLPA